MLDSPFVSILAYQLSKLLILSLHSFNISFNSSTVVALSMAILVWRKSGMPLKIGEETGAWIEGFEREANVIKAFLSKMNTKWAARMDEITVEHIITPFIQEDEMTQIEKWMKGNGNKPIISQKESIKRAGISDDPDATYKEILEEDEAEATRTAASMPNLFSEE